MLGQVLKTLSHDAGDRVMLASVLGEPIRAWNDRGFITRAVYVAARRPTQQWVKPGPGAEQLVAFNIYGEQVPVPEDHNLRGQLYRSYPRGDPKQARGGRLTALLTRPAFAAVLLFLPTILLVRWDLGGTDVPDILTTTALLFILGYGLFVLPIAFVASSIRLARWLWRIGKGSSFRGGLVAGVTTALGALSTCMLCTPPDPDDEADGELFGERLEHGAQVLGTAIERKGLVDDTLGALTQAADVIPGSSGSWALPPALLPFHGVRAPWIVCFIIRLVRHRSPLRPKA